MTTQVNALLASGQTQQAIAQLSHKLENNQATEAECLLLGQLQFEEQLVPESITAFEAFLLHQPDNTDALLALAQSQLLAGFTATETFAKITRLNPAQRSAWHGYALAVASQGNIVEAHQFLESKLQTHGDWVEGHKLLATLKYTQGDGTTFLNSFQQAINQQPQHAQLHQHYFNLLVQNKDWDKAQQLIENMRKQPTLTRFTTIASIILAIESDQTGQLNPLLQQAQHIDDTALDLALVRYFIKQQQLQTAESIAMRRVAKSSALVFIPYLSLIWRLTDSPYFAWLEHNDELVKSMPVHLSESELIELKACLNKLHSSRSPFIEQSVRGGTQTDQHLFLRHEPILRTLRDKLKQTVSRYVAQLPEHDEKTHPLLGKPRAAALEGNVKFSGSWSVKLQRQGYNVSHTHPKGWISSALHLQLPEMSNQGAPDAGFIQFGTPPPELKLNLAPTLKMKPVVGNVVLFPSTMWHSTVPFEQGERLVVAFDVQSPAR